MSEQEKVNDHWSDVENEQRAEWEAMLEIERAAKREAERRGWLIGDINQTDAWFTDRRTPEERLRG